MERPNRERTSHSTPPPHDLKFARNGRLTWPNIITTLLLLPLITQANPTARLPYIYVKELLIFVPKSSITRRISGNVTQYRILLRGTDLTGAPSS